MKKYLRLMSYENCCKVIEFVNSNSKEDYAHITVGGVSMEVLEKNWYKVEEFIKLLGVRYQITDEHPHIINQRIVSNLKQFD